MRRHGLVFAPNTNKHACRFGFFLFSPAGDGHGFALTALWRSQRLATGRWCLGLFVCLVADIVGLRTNIILPRRLIDLFSRVLSQPRLPGYSCIRPS